MDVSVPRERCYYYECSGGRARLTYFIPPDELRRIVSERKISPTAREDFPDGIDLDCTEPDFAAFEAQYGYRPKHAAESLQYAFFAIFSSTRGWKTFFGSGLIPADELEAKIAQVDRTVRAALPEAEVPEREPRTFKERRQRRLQSIHLRARVEKTLADLPVKGVDEKKPIDKQSFSRKIAFSKGRKASEVFTLLQRRNQATQ